MVFGWVWNILTELSNRTIVGWLFFKCTYFLKPCCNYVFQVYLYQRNKKMNVIFTRGLFAFTDCDWYLVCKRSYLIVISQCACSCSWFQGKKFWLKSATIMENRENICYCLNHQISPIFHNGRILIIHELWRYLALVKEPKFANLLHY